MMCEFRLYCMKHRDAVGDKVFEDVVDYSALSITVDWRILYWLVKEFDNITNRRMLISNDVLINIFFK